MIWAKQKLWKNQKKIIKPDCPECQVALNEKNLEAEALKADLENMIRFVYGPKGLEEYKDILRDMRKQKEKTEFKKAKLKQAIIEWTVGIIVTIIAIAIMVFVFWFIGKGQGKW